METFNTIVSCCSGASVIIALLITLIKPIREKITHARERDDRIQQNFNEVRKDIEDVKDDIQGIKEEINEDRAIGARTQILRFADEIYQGQKHTKEHFDQILEACKKYNLYCDTHPDFENMQTVSAQERIKEIYQECMKKHTFLDCKEKNDEDQ